MQLLDIYDMDEIDILDVDEMSGDREFPECRHCTVTLIYEDDEGCDWECLECGFEGHDPYI